MKYFSLPVLHFLRYWINNILKYLVTSFSLRSFRQKLEENLSVVEIIKHTGSKGNCSSCINMERECAC